MTTQERLERNVENAHRRVRRIEARFEHLLETGQASEADIAKSRRHPTTARVFSAADRAERELADWEARCTCRHPGPGGWNQGGARHGDPEGVFRMATELPS